MTTFAPSPRQRHGRPAEDPLSLLIEWPLAMDGAATLAVAIEGDRASAVLVTLTGRRELASSSAVCAIDGPLVHVDAPGVIALTLGPGEGETFRVLYARSPLLQTLGVAGGCIERPRLV